MGAETIIAVISNGVFGVGVWVALWHIDRRLIRLETAAGCRKQAEKE